MKIYNLGTYNEADFNSRDEMCEKIQDDATKSITANKEWEEQVGGALKSFFDCHPEVDRGLYTSIMKRIKPAINNFISTTIAQAKQEAIKECENRDIEVQLNTQQCVAVAKTVYEKYVEWSLKPMYAYKTFPDWLNSLTPDQSKETK